MTDYGSIWAWLRRTSSKATPTRLPPAIQTGVIAHSPFAHNGVAWELRVISVSPNGEPWIDIANTSRSEQGAEVFGPAYVRALIEGIREALR